MDEVHHHGELVRAAEGAHSSALRFLPRSFHALSSRALSFHAALLRARTFGLAAETAFWLFLSLLPLAAVAGLVAARLTTGDWNRFSPVLASLPVTARAFVASELVQVSHWNGGAVGVSSAVAFVWLASSGVDALFNSLESVSGTARSWWRRRLLAIGSCFVLSVAVAALSLLGLGLGSLAVRVETVFPEVRRLGQAAELVGPGFRVLASLVVAFAYVSALYWIGVPRRARVRLPILPGALFAVVMQGVTSVGYGVYVSHVGNGSAYSAGLGIIGLVLTGLYLFALSLLTGVIVNQRIARRRERGSA